MSAATCTVVAGPVGGRPDTELVHLVQTLPRGDRQREAAYEELVIRFRPVVTSCAMRYSRSPESLDELMQAGFMGLLGAINNFDASRGTSLLTYARPCISGEIKRHFRDKRWLVRVQRSAQELRAELLACEAELTQRLGRVPTDTEIARQLRVSTTAISHARDADQVFHPLSLDAPVSSEPDAATLGDVLRDGEDGSGTMLAMEAVWLHMLELPLRQQRILNLRFYGNMTQAQIAREVGISQMHVSRLLAQALGYLREKIAGADR